MAEKNVNQDAGKSGENKEQPEKGDRGAVNSPYYFPPITEQAFDYKY